MAFEFGPRRAISLDITKEMAKEPLPSEELKHFEDFDLIYRSLCAILFNYVPTSGHPGGSISSGRFVTSLLFDGMDYEMGNPDRADADIISYAAGHKALGLYAMWALRDEIARQAAPNTLPKDEKLRLRLEDLLGFRRNPITDTPLFTKFHSKALDGHPTPATPFVKLSTGASGVGVATSLGLAFGARDFYGTGAPRVHIVEGEGGMTPGRVAEAFAAAGTACLDNAFIHIDWNQASIDSNNVCRDGSTPGEYVQWTPAEFCYLHDWNVVFVPDGKNFQQVIAAQRKALEINNGQPTAIVYRTIKGWQYGIEGRASHGAGHKMCTQGFYEALAPFLEAFGGNLPACEANAQRCRTGEEKGIVEECLWEALEVVRHAIEQRPEMAKMLAERLVLSCTRLEGQKRTPRSGAPAVKTIYELAAKGTEAIPKELALEPGAKTTLRGELGKALGYLNRESGGAILAAAADLLGSTSVNTSAKGFAEGFFNTATNPEARILSIGGICEDAISGVLSGISTLGHHIGVGSSYGAFIAPLGHIASRLHAIGGQARHAIKKDEPYHPFVLICAHAGLKTGEDGPTHADPQPLQLLQENFPKGTVITLTPWDPAEVWPLMAAAFARRPAVIAPFVTRPNETVPDRTALKFAPASEAATGLYALRRAKQSNATVVLQGSGVTNAFVAHALPKLDAEGVDLNLYYCASAELFDLLPLSEQTKLFPEEHARNAMGITGLTLPTMYRWVTSELGRAMTMYPYQKGHYLGSGQADMVLAEAGLDGESQFKQIMTFVKEKK